MTDSELLKTLRQIDNLNEKVRRLIDKIGDSGRPDADQIRTDLLEQCATFAHAEHVGGHYLGAGWENVRGTYVYLG